MRHLRPSSDDEMVATFLRQELDSERFGAALRDLMQRERVPAAVITAPDLSDPAGNLQRRRLLVLHRGYGTDANGDQYLSGFPTAGVRWAWCALTPDELLAVRYIDWDYWLELSGGTRRPADAARRIRAGVRAYDVSNDGFLEGAAALRRGARFPELILVAAGDGEPLVVFEGHARLTAYALAPDALAAELPMLVGVSSAVARWGCY